MPPRFAYWTILIDDTPTAFRARDAEELLPTLNQLKRKNANVVMRWFSDGRLWISPEAARDARRRPAPPAEKRAPSWRPGGKHEDPRERFKKKPWSAKPGGPPRGNRPFSGKPPGAPRRDQPWRDKAATPPRSDRPWSSKPPGSSHRDRPWSNKPAGTSHRDRPWDGKRSGSPQRDRPWGGKPSGSPRSDRPWNAQSAPHATSSGAKPGGPPRPPWIGRPPKAHHKPFPPRSAPPSNERRRRDDEPPDHD